MTVDGFVRVEGDCPRHTMKVKAISHTKCGEECFTNRKCMGYVYTFSDRPFPHDACALKSKMCGSTISLRGYNISSYYSTRVTSKLMYLY